MIPDAKWLGTSIVVASVAVAVVALVVWMPWSAARWLLVVFIVVFVGVFWLNPRHRYWHMAVFVATSWLGSRAIPTLVVSANWQENTVGFALLNNVGAAFDVAAVALTACLLVLDYKSRNPSPPTSWLKSRVSTRFGSQRQYADEVSQQAQIGDISGERINVTVNQGISPKDIEGLMERANANVPVQVERPHDFNAEIDFACEYLKGGKPDVAIEFLSTLKRRSWDHLSSRERFRLHANLGHCNVARENLSSAAEHFFSAKSYQPKDEQARALEAYAYLLLDDLERAGQLADAVLIDFPASTLAIAVRIRSAPATMSLSDVEDSIPVPLRAADDVLFSLGWCALGRGELDRAEGFARRGLEIDRESSAVKSQLATVLVRKAAVSASIAPEPNRTIIAILDEAITLLNDVVTRQQGPGVTPPAGVRYNRAIAYSLRGRRLDAENDFRAAIELQPQNPDFVKEYALFRLRHGDADGAIETLRSAVGLKPRIADAILFARLLSQRNRPEDRGEAIAVLEQAAESAAHASEEDRLDYVDTRSSLLGQLGRHDDARALVERCSSWSVSEEAIHAIRANVLRRAGDIESAMQCARKAVAQLNPDSSKSTRSFVAQTLGSLALLGEALEVWKQHLNAKSFDRRHEIALECARQCGDDRFILDFCQELRTNGFVAGHLTELEVATLEKYNELEKAREVIETYLADPTDDALAKAFRVRLSLIGRRLDRTDVIEYDPAKLPNVESVSTHLGRAVAQILRNGPNPMDGVRYAYELLRRNFNSAEAHKTLVAVTRLDDESDLLIPTPEAVDLGCAVKCRENASSTERWIILEDSMDPDVSRQEFAPDSTIGKELLGKKVGESFYLRHDSVQDRTATILAITSKFAYRYLDSIDEWEVRFPGEFFVRKYELPKSGAGELDLSTIFKSLDEQAAHADMLHRVYKDNPISMTSFAKIANVSVIESLSHLGAHSDLPIRCCRGSDEEFAAVADLVRQHATLVLDSAALATLFNTGLFRRVDKLPLTCVVSFGTIEEIRHRLLGTYGSARSKRRIGKEGNRYMFSERTAEEVGESTTSVETFLGWVKSNADIVGGSALARIDIAKRGRLTDLFGQPTAESIAIATGDGYALWTDDFAVAEIANSELDVRRVWSQGLFERLVAQDSMATDILNDFSLQLVVMGFVFTRLMPDVGIEAARKAKWDPAQTPLIDVLKWFHSSGVKPEGAVGLLAAILVAIWREAPLVDQRERVTKALAENVAKRPDGLAILTVFAKNAGRIFGVDVLNAEHCARVIRLVIDRGGHGGGLILPDNNDP